MVMRCLLVFSYMCVILFCVCIVFCVVIMFFLDCILLLILECDITGGDGMNLGSLISVGVM